MKRINSGKEKAKVHVHEIISTVACMQLYIHFTCID